MPRRRRLLARVTFFPKKTFDLRLRRLGHLVLNFVRFRPQSEPSAHWLVGDCRMPELEMLKGAALLVGWERSYSCKVDLR